MGCCKCPGMVEIELQCPQGIPHLHKAAGCRQRTQWGCVGHCLECGFCSHHHTARSMESRHPTLHQDLWVASRPLKISHSIPSTSFPNPGIQNHPFLLMLSLFACRIISSLGDVVPSEKEAGWPLGRVSLLGNGLVRPLGTIS